MRAYSRILVKYQRNFKSEVVQNQLPNQIKQKKDRK